MYPNIQKYRVFALQHLYIPKSANIFLHARRALTNNLRGHLVLRSVFQQLSPKTCLRTVARLGGGRRLGRRVCWTKGNHIKHFCYRVLVQFKYATCWWLALGTRQQYLKKHWVMSALSANRLRSYMYSFYNVNLFTTFLVSPIFFHRWPVLLTYCFWYREFTFVSCLELFPDGGICVARAAGSIARLTYIVMRDILISAIIYPSGLLTFINRFIKAARVEVNFAQQRFLIRRGAGYWRRQGKHPNTRGIAMNATDHPHGGKTHTVACPKSPWGWNTKFK